MSGPSARVVNAKGIVSQVLKISEVDRALAVTAKPAAAGQDRRPRGGPDAPGRADASPDRRAHARLRELDEALDHLRITRKTLLSLADEPDAEPTAPPSALPPGLPEHPAYQQILTIFADTGRALRARDLCQALDLPIVSKNTENIRAKLKRLVSKGILVETEPGLFAQPHL
jgi:hypothetical protein